MILVARSATRWLALVRIAPDFGALAAAHVAFQFMDRRCLRSPHDVERDGLMRVAAKAFHFEIAEPGIDAHRPASAMAAPDPESRACACSTPRRRAGRLPCALPSPALPPPGPIRRKSSRVIWCPWTRGCAGPRWTGKPLQIAVDGVPPTGSGRSSSRSRNRAAQAANGQVEMFRMGPLPPRLTWIKAIVRLPPEMAHCI